MKAIFKLLFFYFIRSFHSIFFSFFFPLIMLVLLIAVQKNSNFGHSTPAINTLPGLAMSSASVLGIVSLSMTYSDFKQSIIIKRIGATPLRSWEFILPILIFHVALIFISNFWIIAVGAIFYHDTLHLGNVNWGYVILAILFAATICSAIGIIVGVLAPDYKIANAFALLLYLPTAFLTGQYIPYAAIADQNVLVVISKILPFSYPVSIMNKAWTHYGDMHTPTLFDNYWLPSVVSLAWIVALVALAIIVYKYRKK